METCFNFSRCRDRPFRHYVYPTEEHAKITDNYRKVLDVLESSPLYTADPSEACLFVLSLDTLSRDPLAKETFVPNLQQRLDALEHWNGGENHVVFNLYSGTYPDYNEQDIGFDLGKAILAKASVSNDAYRPGFDISLPLFHGRYVLKTFVYL